MQNNQKNMIPLMIEVEKLNVLVFGAGAVGRRKAGYFKGCRVTFVTKSSGCDVSIISDEALDSFISSHDIIIAALSDAGLNEKICAAAEKCGKFYNSATAKGNFLIPAAFSEGDVTLCISTNGKAPALATFLRDELVKSRPHIAEMAELQNRMRSSLKVSVSDETRRAEILRSVLADEKIWAALPDIDEAERLCRSIYLD